MAKWTLSDSEFERQYQRALAAEDDSRSSIPKAVSASYEPDTGLVWIRLDNECVFGFPPALVEGLRDASAADLAEVQVLPQGVGLHWEALDVDLSIAGLLTGVFGSRSWMKALGRLGGKSKSEAKARAARANGAKGGRPRKDTSGEAQGGNTEGFDPGPAEYWSPDADSDLNAHSLVDEEVVAYGSWASRTPGGSNTPGTRTPAAAA